MGEAARQHKIRDILHETLSNRNIHFYFEPPESKKIEYPAVIYQRKNIDSFHANNKKYLVYDRYQVTYIRRDIDSDVIDILENLTLVEHTNEFQTDDLYHDVFTFYII